MKKSSLALICAASVVFPTLLSRRVDGQSQTSSTPEEGITLHRFYRVSSNSDLIDVPEQTSTMYLDAEAIRQVQPDGTELIVYHRLGKMVRIDHNRKAYSEVTFDELQTRLDEISDEISHEDQATLDELRKMAGKSGNDSVVLEKVGPGEMIAGYTTVIYRISVAPLVMTLWVAPELKVPEIYYDTMRIHAKPNPLFDTSKLFDALKQIEGLSLRNEVTMSIMGEELTSVDEVTKVERGPIPSPRVPEGYTREEAF